MGDWGGSLWGAERHLSRDLNSEKDTVIWKSWGKTSQTAGMMWAKVLGRPQICCAQETERSSMSGEAQGAWERSEMRGGVGWGVLDLGGPCQQE